MSNKPFLFIFLTVTLTTSIIQTSQTSNPPPTPVLQGMETPSSTSEMPTLRLPAANPATKKLPLPSFQRKPTKLSQHPSRIMLRFFGSEEGKAEESQL